MCPYCIAICSETATSPKSTSWVPATGSTSAAVTPGVSSTSSVAFDEMSQVDVNRRDSELADMPASSQLASSSFKSQVSSVYYNFLFVFSAQTSV